MMHIRVIGICLAAVFLAAAHVFPTPAKAADKTFVFTAIPDQDESRLRTRFEKVATYLSAELGVPVEYVPVKS